MANKPIPFAAYEPDKGAASGAGMTAKGVISRAKRFVPLPNLVPYRAGSGLLDACLGGGGFYDSVGAPKVFLGDMSALYLVDADKVVQNVSKSGGYSVDTDWQWSFDQFGNNIIAAGRGATLQRFEIGTSSVFEDIAGALNAMCNP